MFSYLILKLYFSFDVTAAHVEGCNADLEPCRKGPPLFQITNCFGWKRAKRHSDIEIWEKRWWVKRFVLSRFSFNLSLFWPLLVGVKVRFNVQTRIKIKRESTWKIGETRYHKETNLYTPTGEDIVFHYAGIGWICRPLILMDKRNSF